MKQTIKEQLNFQDLSQEEKEKRGILGRLYGPCASISIPTRNGRMYQESLWDYQFKNNEILREMIENGGIPMELDHPQDRTETNSEKIAAMLPELPKKDKNGHLICYCDLLDTPCGRIAYQLAKYGFKLGISSRGQGDLITDDDGNESVDPETFDLTTFDLVLVPAVKDARLSMCESLNKTRYKKTLRSALQESLDKATDDERKVMKEALDDLGIELNEDKEKINMIDPKEMVNLILKDADPGVITKINDHVIANGEGPVSLEYNFKKDGSVLVRGENDGEHVNYKYSSQRDFLRNTIDADWMIDEDVLNDLRNRFGIKEEDLEEIEFSSKDDEWYNESLKEEFNPTESFIDALKEWKEEILFNKGEDYDNDDFHAESYEGLVDSLIEDVIRDADKNFDNLTHTIEDKVESMRDKKSIMEIVDILIKEAQEEDKKEVIESKSCKEEIKDEKEPNVLNKEVGNEVVDDLQEALKENALLKKQMHLMQDKVAVGNSKVKSLSEEVEKYKNLTVKLSDKALEAKELTEKVSALEEELKNKKIKINKLIEAKRESLSHDKTLNESITKKESDIRKLQEKFDVMRKTSISKIGKLEKEVEDLKADSEVKLNESRNKILKANKLVEQYKQLAEDTVDRYIATRAKMLGVSVNRIKNELSESYSIDDIDNICDELLQSNINFGKLPISINKNTKVRVTESKNDNLHQFTDSSDDIDDQLLRIAGLKK